ncbi:MAG: hypothetical protein K0B08_10270 [Bacteroidales bacterium]|nr:hypothetical protein [Bacteroidales bacterium]
MDKQLIISPRFRYLVFALMGIGIMAFVYGFITNPTKTWANLLVNNYYFLAIAIGATFFLALQYITQSGWSSGFVRVPQAIGNFIPVIGILMIPILFGVHSIYEWTHPEALATDPIIEYKSPYLNMPFFIIRLVIYFAAWIFLTQLLRRFSLREDRENGLTYFHKSEFYSKVYIFTLALTFSLASFDWIMSIDVHWFSTIFAVRNFIMAFFHATAIITLIVIILNKLGYFPFLTKAHLRDFSKYIFALSIIWVYMWFSQYILIWYANIPEETVYYLPRTKGEFVPLFYGELIINWLFPFLALMSNKVKKNANALIVICSVLVIGQWIDIYQQVIVGTYHHLEIGFIEIGTFLGFIGLFAYVTARSLAAVPLVPKHHPYLEESLEHH